MENKQKIDTKIKFLYETFSQQSDIYREAIIEAYYKLFASDKYSLEDYIKLDYTPAEIIDDLAMVLYEVEKVKENEEI